MPANPGLFAQALAEEEAKKRQYGQITGVTPVAGPVPGIMEVQTANGGTRRFVGNTPGMETVRGAMMSPNPNAATGPAPTQTGPANEWEPYKTSEDGMQVLLRKGGDPSNPRDVREVVPGRAATKGGLALRGQTVSGAQNVDPEKLSAIEGVAKSEQDLRNESAERVNAIALKRQELMAGEQQAASNQAAVQFHENSVKADQFKKVQAKYDEAEREYADMPTAQAAREKAGNSGLAGLAKALVQGLGAFGAGMARTPNFAAEVLERDAERRMRRDESELRVKKDAVNLLGDLRDKMGGSLELARSAYLAIDSKKRAIGFEMLASKESDQEKAANLRMIAQQEWKGHLKWKEALERNAEGEISRTFQNMPGSAGSAGGVRSARASSVDKRDPNAPGAKPPDSMPLVATTAVADDASLVALGNKILTNPAMKDSDSEFWGPKGSITAAIPGGSYVAGSDENRLQQDMQQYLNVRIKQMTGAGMAESEASRLAKAEIGSGSANDIRRGVANGTLTAARRARSNLATQDPRNRESLLKEMDPYSKQLVGGGK